MRYRRKPVLVEAVQWFKVGDHPEVRRYLDVWPDSDPNEVWSYGWLETVAGHGTLVRPADWVLTPEFSPPIVMRPKDFALTYEPVPDAENQGESR